MSEKLNSEEICLLAYLLTLPKPQKRELDLKDFNFEDNLGKLFKSLASKGYLIADTSNEKIIINLD